MPARTPLIEDRSRPSSMAVAGGCTTAPISRDHDEGKLEILAERIAGIWGSRPPTQALTGVAALALPGMLFEIDVIAVADGSS